MARVSLIRASAHKLVVYFLRHLNSYSNREIQIFLATSIYAKSHNLRHIHGIKKQIQSSKNTELQSLKSFLKLPVF